MNTPTHPQAARTTNRRTANHTARTMHTLTLAVAGDQDVTVHTHHGDTEVNFFAGRHLTLTLATLIVYCHTQETVAMLTEAWQNARLHINELPVNADTRIRTRLRRQIDANAALTSAVTRHQPMGWDATLIPARSTGDQHPALIVSTGPITVNVRDQAALLRICEAWETANDAARELWAPPTNRARRHPLPSDYTARRPR